MSENNNATWLFQKPKKQLHHSEPFWASFFALTVLTMSIEGQKFHIPRYRYRRNTEEWRFIPDESEPELEIPCTVRWEDIIVGGGIIPSCDNGQQDLRNLKPDVYISRDAWAKIIEVKTVGCSLSRQQIESYLGIRRRLIQDGKNAELYFLLSAGHEIPKDEYVIAELQASGEPFWILLWEDVLELIDKQVPCLAKLFPPSITLADYYKDLTGLLSGKFHLTD